MKSETTDGTIFDNPIWCGIARETELAAQLLWSGAHEIGAADYANLGKYATAQFNFSNGIERLCKLILTAHSFLTHGKPLSDSQLRKYGHSLVQLADEVEKVTSSRSLELMHPRPKNEITDRVMLCLDNFASARRGRYANLASLDGNMSPYDPTTMWWNEVCVPILQRHFYGSPTEKAARRNAKHIALQTGGWADVLFFHENGQVITDVETCSFMTAERVFTQKYGRYYTLLQVRWMSSLFVQLTMMPGYSEGHPYLFGHYERLHPFLGGDDHLMDPGFWQNQPH